MYISPLKHGCFNHQVANVSLPTQNKYIAGNEKNISHQRGKLENHLHSTVSWEGHIWTRFQEGNQPPITTQLKKPMISMFPGSWAKISSRFRGIGYYDFENQPGDMVYHLVSG